MKKYWRIAKLVSAYRVNIVLYFLYTGLSILFSIFSIGALPYFLQLIFSTGKISIPPIPQSKFDLLKMLNHNIAVFIVQHGPNGKIYALAIICVLTILFILLKNLFLFLSYFVLSPIKMGVITNLRGAIYEKILSLPIGFFTEKHKGDVMSRMTNDIAEVEISVVGTLEGFIKDPLNVIVILAILIWLSPALSLFLLILLPLTAVVIGRISRSLKKNSNISAIKLGETLSVLEETIGGLRVIKAFNAENILKEKFDTMNQVLYRIRNKMQIRRDLASPLSEFLGIVVLCGILWFGGSYVLSVHHSGALDATSFIMYIGLFTQVINPAKSISTSFYNMQKGSAAVERIEEILRAPEVIEDTADSVEIKEFTKEIEFRHINFSYGEKPILHDINLKIKKGQTIALVGASGSGKSTLADLIPRFHDATTGTIFLDGKDIKSIKIKSLRNLMGIVTQEPILFNETIANNIKLGIEDVTQEAIEKAAKIANAESFIKGKKEGFASNIGDRGSKLSGGERQRITIARAVLKNPPILILDEATSSLDTESERLVQEAITHMTQNRTCLVIAHRLSTIKDADEIIVLNKGEIIERGKHEELIAQNGQYKKLVEMQQVK